MKPRNIGMNTKPSHTKVDSDASDPYFGKLGVRGKVLVGTIIKAKAPKTATLELSRWRKVPKYERYEKRRTRITVHNPPSINAEAGDIVTVAECRPISKSKRFVIISKEGKEKLFEAEQQLREEGKFKKTDKEMRNIEKEQQSSEE